MPDAVATIGPGERWNEPSICDKAGAEIPEFGEIHLAVLECSNYVGFLGVMLANAWVFADGNSAKTPALGLQKGSWKGWMYKDGVKYATFHNMKVIVLDLIPKKLETSCFFFLRASYCKQISKCGSYLCVFTLYYMLSEHFTIKVQTLLGKRGPKCHRSNHWEFYNNSKAF